MTRPLPRTLLLATLVAGCADLPPDAPQAEPGLALWFAALTSTACAPTGSGSGANAIPADVETLAVDLIPASGERRIMRANRSAAAKGFWEVKGIPASDDLDIEVFGCSKDKKVVWAGRTNDLQIVDQQDTKTTVFMAPTAKLACTGGATGGATLQAGRSLAGGAVLASGDAVVVGGVQAWQDKQFGTASSATDVFDHRRGQFRKGPELVAPRIGPHVQALGGAKVLVSGGVTAVKRSGQANQASPLFVPEKLDAALPAAKAEVLDLTEGGPAKGVASSADVGLGARPLSSAIHLGAELLFVGGIDDAGAALAKATRLGNLGDVAAGGAGVTAEVSLAVARARPALLKFPDGTAIVWGGAATKAAADMGELLAPGASAGTKLVVTGADALLSNPHLATVGPSAVPLQVSDGVLAFLVVGGVPFATPTKATDAPSYVVVVDKAAGTAELKTVTLSQGTLRGGLGTTAVQLPSGHVLVAGGLVSLLATPGVCPSPDECILDGYVLLDRPTDLAGASLTLTVATSGSLGTPHFGMVGLPAPMGALLAGGQTSVFAEPADVLDNAGQVVVLAPAADREAEVCQ